jgi:hypothetical protein
MSVNRRRLLSTRGGSSAGVMAFLAVAMVGGGLYIASRQVPAPKLVAAEDHLAQVAALARVERDAEWLQRAIRERQAIIGMTFREVEEAKGRPAEKQRGEALTVDDRAKGGVEKWLYAGNSSSSAFVLFGASGLVISSSDVGGVPLPGQSVRQ